MEYELTAHKLDNNTHLVKNKHTNEPIAILKKQGGYSKNEVTAEWHPDYKLLHPETHENLLTRNFAKPFDSVAAAVNSLTYSSEKYAKGDEPTHDPVKTVYAGEFDSKNQYDEPTVAHKWHVHDDDGKHIASITSFHGPNEIHKDSHVNVGWVKSFSDAVPESVKEASAKKYAEKNLEHALHRIRYQIDNKGKEPRFIGSQASKSSSNKTFKTKLSPDEASNAYEEHLKKKLGTDAVFTRHSPTVFSVHKPATSVYSSAEQHHVISMPGELHHVQSSFDHPEYMSSSNKNSQIIESYMGSKTRAYYPLTLEEHMSVHKFLRRKVR